MVGTPLIFYSTDYESALAKGREFAVELLGSLAHPDFLELAIEGKAYTKEQITLFLGDIALAPYEAKYKVYLFPMADKMLPVHANALLKTFEEKPDHAVILLVTDNIKGVIETILSRAKKVFVPEFKKEVACSEKVKKALEFASNGDLYASLDVLGEIEEIHIEEVIETFFHHHKNFLEKAHAWVGLALNASERHTKPKLILEYLVLKSYSFAILTRYAVTP